MNVLLSESDYRRHRAMNLLSRWFRRLPTAPSWIEPAALAARPGRDSALLIIDVRGPDEFTGELGHIRGATNVPLNELAARLPDLVREKPACGPGL
jgi:hypothetical protein